MSIVLEASNVFEVEMSDENESFQIELLHSKAEDAMKWILELQNLVKKAQVL